MNVGHTPESGRSKGPALQLAAATPNHVEDYDLTLTEYSSFLEKGSTVLFLIPFLPLDKRLFLEIISHRGLSSSQKRH